MREDNVVLKINRVTRLAVSRSLSELLAALTLLLLWGALISLVLWLTAGEGWSATTYYAKGAMLIAMLLSSLSGMLAVYVWSVERLHAGQELKFRERDW
jgi:hypothetical protein